MGKKIVNINLIPTAGLKLEIGVLSEIKYDNYWMRQDIATELIIEITKKLQPEMLIEKDEG